MSRALLPAILLVAVACSACGPAPEDPARRAKVQSGTDAAVAPPASGAGEDATAQAPDDNVPHDGTARYACSDGSSVIVAARGEQAIVEMSDGRSATLPKAQSASNGGGDVFVGEAISVQREGESAALLLDGGERSNCQAADAAE